MTTVTMAARYVTWVSESESGRNFFGKTGYLDVQGGAGQQKQAILWFTSPFPATGANVTSARLRLRTRAIVGAGTHTLQVRPAAKWALRFGSVNWTNRPLLTGFTHTVSKSGAQPENAIWDFDVAATMQQVANGGDFVGLIVASPVAERIMVQGAMGAALLPTLTVTWTEAPKAPGSLSPAGGRSVGEPAPTLRWDFYDQAGETRLQAVQVQLATSAAGFGAPLWDSGAVATSWCQLSLEDSGFTGAGAGTYVWWRVRNQDTAGLWSAWSEVTSWRFDALPSVKLVNPNPATQTVTDPTPPIDWQFTTSGSAQQRWRVGIYRLVGTRWQLAQASGEQVGAATSWTPSKSIGEAGRYKAIVDVFDSRNREATPGVPTYVSASSEFTFVPSDSVAGVSQFTAASVPNDTSVALNWRRAEQPDQWVIYRDGQVLARKSGAELLRSPGVYGITDAFVPEGPHSWLVYAIVNGVASKSGGVSAKVRHGSTWLRDPDTGAKLRIVGDVEHDMSLPEVTAVFEPLGARSVSVVTSAQRGYEGTISGQIVQIPGGAAGQAVEWKERLLEFKTNPGGRYELMVEDMVLPVNIWGVTVKGVPGYGGEAWQVSFNFAQIDGFTFDPVGF